MVGLNIEGKTLRIKDMIGSGKTERPAKRLNPISQSIIERNKIPNFWRNQRQRDKR